MTNEPIQTQQYPSKHPFEEDTISLMDILLALARHLKLIITVSSIFCIVAIIYGLYFTSPIYDSKATFMSSGSGGEQSQMTGFASQFGFSFPKSATAQWSYTDVIKSRTLARAMLNRKFDTEKYGPQKTLLQILTYGEEEPAVGIDNKLIIGGIGKVQGMIAINTFSTSSMYELTISAFEPRLASDVAIAVMDELDRHQRDYNAKKTTETRQFIEERLIDTKIELEKSEEALKEFRERNRSILESPHLQLEQGRLTRDVSVLISVFTTLKQQLETAKIDEVKKSDYIVILDAPEIPLHPANTNKKSVVILAGLIGIGLGMAMAFISEYSQIIDSKEKEKIKNIKSLIVKNITDFLPNRFRKI